MRLTRSRTRRSAAGLVVGALAMATATACGSTKHAAAGPAMQSTSGPAVSQSESATPAATPSTTSDGTRTSSAPPTSAAQPAPAVGEGSKSSTTGRSSTPPKSSAPPSKPSQGQPPATTPQPNVPAVPAPPLDANGISAQAWLDPSQMPLDAVHHWQWSPMLNPPFGGTLCGNTTFDRLGAATVRAQIAVDGIPASDPHSNQTVETQSIVFFSDEHAAAAALDVYNAAAVSCQSTGSGTSPGLHHTATLAHAGAWSRYPTTGGGSGGAAIESHIYVVQSGPTLSLMTVATVTAGGTPNPAYQAVDDQTVLTDMATRLAQYTKANSAH